MRRPGIWIILGLASMVSANAFADESAGNLPPTAWPPGPNTFPATDGTPPPGAALPPPPSDYRPSHRRWSGADVDLDSDWLIFRVAEMAAFQTGTHQFAPYFSWSPRFAIHGGESYFGFNIGGSDLTDATSSGFFVLDYLLDVGTTLGDTPFGVEAGIGGQSWVNSNGDEFPQITGGIFYGFGSTVDRVFINYSAVLVGGFYTDEVKLGLSFRF